eukprot:PhF_6_TR1984/c0_g1_i1/m.3324
MFKTRTVVLHCTWLFNPLNTDPLRTLPSFVHCCHRQASTTPFAICMDTPQSSSQPCKHPEPSRQSLNPLVSLPLLCHVSRPSFQQPNGASRTRKSTSNQTQRRTCKPRCHPRKSKLSIPRTLWTLSTTAATTKPPSALWLYTTASIAS